MPETVTNTFKYLPQNHLKYSKYYIAQFALVQAINRRCALKIQVLNSFLFMAFVNLKSKVLDYEGVARH